ncbi:MAG TPA: biotin/lipoyl-binding protein, partial [Azonexus sp.]|nr:biotin/lipoyl-binding protein [Azonexus sp.]
MPLPAFLRRRGVGPALAAAVVLGGVATWLAGDRVDYETTPVVRADIEATVTAIGTLQPRRYVDVGAQVSGQIVRLHVQPGSQVAQGDLLVEIDPSVQRATVDAGRAALAGLRAQLAEQQAQRLLAQQQNERQQELALAGATRLEDVQT